MKHLNSLSVKNFKCLEDFRIEKLGDVNLIVGANNSGKSTVLEALRVYASRGALYELDALLKVRQTPQALQSLERYAQFFIGRKFPVLAGVKIEIGDPSVRMLTIEHQYKQIIEVERKEPSGDTVLETRKVVLPKPLTDEQLSRSRAGDLKIAASLTVENKVMGLQSMRAENFVPWPMGWAFSGAPSVADIAQLWAKVTSPQQEEDVIEVLRWLEPDCRALKVIPDDKAQSVVVSLGGDYVPLGSLGDGMRFLLYLVLQAHAAQNGFLLIDEVENGLHYSVQDKVWHLLFKLAKQFNIQIFATTHSWDAVESFKRVGQDTSIGEAVLCALGKSLKIGDNNKVVSVVYDSAEFATLSRLHIEVR